MLDRVDQVVRVLVLRAARAVDRAAVAKSRRSHAAAARQISLATREARRRAWSTAPRASTRSARSAPRSIAADGANAEMGVPLSHACAGVLFQLTEIAAANVCEHRQRGPHLAA